jgi:hypothetical protein
MFRKLILSLVLGGALVSMAPAAEVIVRVGPPRPIVERLPPRPGPAYVWTPGYYRWQGERHVWVGGVWVVPPRAHARWVPAHWVKAPGGWRFIEGHWR